MRRGMVCVVFGLVLIVFSSHPLYLMGQEVLIQHKVSQDYEIANVYHPMDRSSDSFNTLQYLQDGTMRPFPEMKREVYVNGERIADYDEFLNTVNVSGKNKLSRVISFYSTDIAIEDTFTGTLDSEARENAEVRILIQGTNYAEPVPLEIRPTHLDNNRYHGYLGMLKMTRRNTNEEQFIIIQRLFEHPFSTSEKDFKWKVVSIQKDGSIKTDLFTRDQIDDPAFRRDFINKATVSPYALGYRSNVLQTYPSLFFPLIYPFGMLGCGLLFLGIGLVLRMRRR